MLLPSTRRSDVSDSVHGVRTFDPYRWLEDSDNPAVRLWDDAQDKHARSALAVMGTQEKWAKRLRQATAWGAVGAAKLASGRVFSLDRWGDKQQPVLVMRLANTRATDTLPQIVADPARLFSEDETATIDWFQPDPAGKLIALGISHSGRERSSLYVLDMETGEFVGEPIADTPFATVAWWPDSRGFAYTCNPDGDPYHRHIRAHRLGNRVPDPVLFGPLVDPTAWPDISISSDGRTYLVHVAYGWSRVDCYLLDRETGQKTVVIEGEVATSRFVFSEANIVGVTNLASPRGRVVIAPIASPATANWRTLISEGESVLDAVAVADGALIVAAQYWAAAELSRWPFDGSRVGGPARQMEMPQVGTFSIHGSTPGCSAYRQVAIATQPDLSAAFVTFSSFSQPPSLYEIGVREDAVFARLPGLAKPEDIVTERRWASSPDGTNIPYFVARDGTKELDAEPPTILSGYGGFAINTTPAWDPFAYVHCSTGGVYVAACIRGGAEGGTEWHQAGIRDKKSKGFDDFLAVGDMLISEGVTSRRRLTIRGSSNGGLLVAAALTRRPDFCAAVHCAVPLTDMLRYDRFSMARLWMPDYGDPSIEEEFHWLLDYSPYHHVRDGAGYPSVLLTTGREDTRVAPSHARKFAAALQNALADSEEPDRILLRIDKRAGHGPGKPSSMKIDESADVLAFLRRSG